MLKFVNLPLNPVSHLLCHDMFSLLSESYRRTVFVVEIVGSVASVILAEYLRTGNGICCGFCSALAYPYSVGIVCIVYHTAAVL